MKGSSQGLDTHINVKSEKPVSGSDFTTTDLFRGNDLSRVNNVFKCAHWSSAYNSLKKKWEQLEYIIIMTRSMAPMLIKSHIAVKNVFAKYN